MQSLPPCLWAWASWSQLPSARCRCLQRHEYWTYGSDVLSSKLRIRRQLDFHKTNNSANLNSSSEKVWLCPSRSTISVYRSEEPRIIARIVRRILAVFAVNRSDYKIESDALLLLRSSIEDHSKNPAYVAKSDDKSSLMLNLKFCLLEDYRLRVYVVSNVQTTSSSRKNPTWCSIQKASTFSK